MQQLAAIAEALDALERVEADQELIEGYSSRFSRMRSAAAMHQANWPAVMLGERPYEYRASIIGGREANREFVTWTRQSLVRLERGE